MTTTKSLITALAVLVLSVVGPSASAEEEEEPPRYGFAETCVSVIQQPDVPGKGYRVGGGVKAWNSAQGLVRFWNKVVTGCGVVDVGLFAAGTCPVLNGACDGYVDWPQWMQGSWDPVLEKWTYHHAILRLAYEPAMSRWPRCRARTVMAHELGHTLGLPHSTGTTSVMSYEYDWATHCGALDSSDVAAMVALYTPKVTP